MNSKLLSPGSARTAWRRLAEATALCLGLTSPLLAQQEPIIGVEINSISLLSGQGSVLGVRVSDAGSGYSSAPAVSFSGGGGTGAAATATITSGVVTKLTLTSGGTGYTSAPTISIAAPGTPATATAPGIGAGGVLTTGPLVMTAPGSGYTTAPTVTITGTTGTGAAATATVTGGAVSVNVTNGGTGYSGTIKVTIAPPGTQATAVVTGLGTVFDGGSQNESYGSYGTTVLISTMASGTFPASGYSYEFFVNGISLGIPVPSPTPAGEPGVIGWAPPQPGAYLFTVKASDGAHTATSLAVRYFATGTAIIGPVDNSLVPNGSSVVIQATAIPPPSGTNAFVQRVEFYIDGALRGTDYTYPYSFIYTPEATPTLHTIEARGYDNNGNLVSPAGTALRRLSMIPPVGTPPTVALVNPLNNASISAGEQVSLIADAVSPFGFIKNVDFYVNGVALASSQTFPFTTKWTSQVPGRYEFVAIASDDKSNAVASSPVVVNVTGGFPTVSITTPTAAGATVIQGTTLSVRVKAAGADGGIASLSTIDLLVDGKVSASLPENPTGTVPVPPLEEPFDFNWKSNVSLGSHTLAARVTSATGLTITSAPVPITVIANQLPTVVISSPEDGGSGTVSNAVTLTAAASDPDGAIKSVEFFVNGVSLGEAVTRAPYQFAWTPNATGTYTITAKATDNAEASTTSAEIQFTASPTATGSGGSSMVYRGTYQSSTEVGTFTFGMGKTGRGTFIATSTSPAGKSYFWTDFPVAADGTFSVGELSGMMGATGVSGSFGNRAFIGPVLLGGMTPMIMSGSLTGVSGSTLIALYGGDGSLTLYAASGGKSDSGTGTVASNGTYSIPTLGGGVFTGVLTTSAGVLSGTVSGPVTGTFLFQPVPSRLINLSTRSVAGAGENILVSGFILKGTGTKPLLIRAVGPTLATFGVGSPLANPTLSILNRAGGELTRNDDWNGDAIKTLAEQVGAFGLPVGSKDSALQVALAADGVIYNALVGGASSPGEALLELYDTQPAGTGTARLWNMSSRTLVPAGQTMMAGFVIGGDERKKLLIRAVGPTLAQFGITNPMPDPKLEVTLGESTIASGDNWTAVVSSTTTAVSAFPLLPGSRDAAIVVQLMPGKYSVQVKDNTGAAGVVLLEIYDAD